MNAAYRPCAIGAVLAAMLVGTPARELRAQATGALLPTASASPRTYAGNCPASIEFVGRITATVPGMRVEYQWERSNGTTSKVLHAQIGQTPAAGAPPDTSKSPLVTESVASDKWRIGLPGKSGQFWEKLHVLAPVDVVSPLAPVDVTCRD